MVADWFVEVWILAWSVISRLSTAQDCGWHHVTSPTSRRQVQIGTEWRQRTLLIGQWAKRAEHSGEVTRSRGKKDNKRQTLREVTNLYQRYRFEFEKAALGARMRVVQPIVGALCQGRWQILLSITQSSSRVQRLLAGSQRILPDTFTLPLLQTRHMWG